jgi:glycosyltransferase involved in cell wall biosynthesis
MRIAYVSLHWPRTIHSGVGKKIAAQINAWQTAGHEVRLFMHLHAGPYLAELLPGGYFEYAAPASTKNKFKEEIGRSSACAKLVSDVNSYKPDLIYLRQGVYVFPVHKLRNIAPVVIEINTNDVEQHKQLGRTVAFYNYLTRNLFYGSAAGFVFVSCEFAQKDVFTRFHKLTEVIGNGIDLEKIFPFPAPANEHPRLVFVGTSDFPWNGFDKLVQFAWRFPALTLDLIGVDAIPHVDKLPQNVKLHGYLTGSKYINVLAMADAAIGTTALHRYGIKERSTLKMNEYLAYGLPVVLPYEDTNILGLEHEMVFRIPNTEDNFEKFGQQICDFAYRMRGKRIPRETIASCISLSVKEAKRLEFFNQIVETSR